MLRHMRVATLVVVLVNPLLVIHAGAFEFNTELDHELSVELPRYEVVERMVQCNMGGAWTKSAGCQCYEGHNGDACQYSDTMQCSKRGKARADGTCECELGFIGPSCSERTAIAPVLSENLVQVSEAGQTGSYTVRLSREPEGAATLR
eukprot:2149871-Pyramimonas_sp.AAC.1